MDNILTIDTLRKRKLKIFFLIGKKNIIENGVARKIHRVHDSEQRVIRKQKVTNSH